MLPPEHETVIGSAIGGIGQALDSTVTAESDAQPVQVSPAPSSPPLIPLLTVKHEVSPTAFTARLHVQPTVPPTADSQRTQVYPTQLRASLHSVSHHAYFDNCTSMPLFNDCAYFESLQPLVPPVTFSQAEDEASFTVLQHGVAHAYILNSMDGMLVHIRIADAYYVPSLRTPLLNFPDLDSGGSVEYYPDSFKIFFKSNSAQPALWLRRPANSRLLPISLRPFKAMTPSSPPESSTTAAAAVANAARNTALDARHALALARAGHPGRHIERLLRQSATLTDYLPAAVPQQRTAGDLLGKMTRSAFPSKRDRLFEHGLWLALDTSGPHLPAPDVFNGGRMVKFMLVLIDLGSKFVWVYFMAHKSEAATILRTHFSKHGSSRFLKSDNALELTGAAMNQLKADFGIVQWTTCDYTSEQNPAERAMSFVASLVIIAPTL